MLNESEKKQKKHNQIVALDSSPTQRQNSTIA